MTSTYKNPFIIAGVISSIAIFLVVFTKVPLGIPGNWLWLRVSSLEIPFFELFTLIFIVILGATSAYLTDLKMKRKSILGISIIISLGVFFDYQVMLCGRVSINENILAVANGRLTGYLTQAYEIGDIGAFMSDYHIVLRKSEAMPEHVDVHPPGNTLYSYLMLSTVRNARPLVKTIIDRLVSPWEMVNSQNMIMYSSSYPGGNNVTLNDYNYASILIVISFLFFLGISKALLITSIFVLNKNPRHLGLCALFLWSIPAPILFLGSYDTLYYFFSCVLCLVLSFWTRRGGRIYILMTGILCGGTMLFSIGFASVIFLVTFILIFKKIREPQNSIVFVATFVLGGLISILIYYILDVRIIEICYQCARNNTHFVNGADRSIAWSLVNYLDYMLFVGALPIVFLCVYLRNAIKSRFRCGLLPEGISTAYLLTLILILSSSFCRGESGRLLLLLIPFNILITCYSIQKFSGITSWNYFVSMLSITISIIQLVIFRVQLMTLVQF